jgi:hypothetical protein
VFENQILRRISGSKRDKMTGDWRKLHTENFHNLYSSTSIIRMLRSRRLRWAGYVACGAAEKYIQDFDGKGR